MLLGFQFFFKAALPLQRPPPGVEPQLGAEGQARASSPNPKSFSRVEVFSQSRVCPHQVTQEGMAMLRQGALRVPPASGLTGGAAGGLLARAVDAGDQGTRLLCARFLLTSGKSGPGDRVAACLVVCCRASGETKLGPPPPPRRQPVHIQVGAQERRAVSHAGPAERVFPPG